LCAAVTTSFWPSQICTLQCPTASDSCLSGLHPFARSESAYRVHTLPPVHAQVCSATAHRGSFLSELESVSAFASTFASTYEDKSSALDTCTAPLIPHAPDRPGQMPALRPASIRPFPVSFRDPACGQTPTALPRGAAPLPFWSGENRAAFSCRFPSLRQPRCPPRKRLSRNFGRKHARWFRRFRRNLLPEGVPPGVGSGGSPGRREPAFSAGSLWAAVAKRLQTSPPTRQGLVNTQYEKTRRRY